MTWTLNYLPVGCALLCACGSGGTSPSGGSSAEAGSGGDSAGSTSSGGTDENTGETGADPGADEAIEACLAEAGLSVDCAQLGSGVRAFAFGRSLNGRDAVCGPFDAAVPPFSIAFVVDPDLTQLVVHAIRLRAESWSGPLLGEWWQLIPPEPIVVTDETPLSAAPSDWSWQAITFANGLGWLFQAGETADVELTFTQPLTREQILQSQPVQLSLTLRGGRYLRTLEGDRDLVDEPTALGVACLHTEAGIALTPNEGTMACGPDFDRCPAGFQLCPLDALDNEFACLPDARCEAECGWPCGPSGEGACEPPWVPA